MSKDLQRPMSEVVAGLDPDTLAVMLVVDHDSDGYELYSRYENSVTAQILLQAAQKLLSD